MKNDELIPKKQDIERLSEDCNSKQNKVDILLKAIKILQNATYRKQIIDDPKKLILPPNLSKESEKFIKIASRYQEEVSPLNEEIKKINDEIMSLNSENNRLTSKFSQIDEEVNYLMNKKAKSVQKLDKVDPKKVKFPFMQIPELICVKCKIRCKGYFDPCGHSFLCQKCYFEFKARSIKHDCCYYDYLKYIAMFNPVITSLDYKPSKKETKACIYMSKEDRFQKA